MGTSSRPDAGRTLCWRPEQPLDVRLTLSALRRGRGDPTHHVDAAGAVWRTARTEAGVASMRLVQVADGTVHVTAWGPGARAVLDAVPTMLGADDEPGGFAPQHPLLRESAARHPGLRVPRIGAVFEVLVAAVLEQKVTGSEARRSWRELVRRFGKPAPGPVPAGMRVAPAAAVWRRIPSWEWHRAGVGPQRARTVVTAAAVGSRLEESLELPVSQARDRLLAVPGVGAWTVAEVMQRSHGDADAVSVGDFHLPALVGWALTGRPLDDDGMLQALAPYAGHRYRAVRLVEISGFRKPRFGPRYAPADLRAI